MSTTKNHSNLGADLIRIASLSGEVEAGPIFLAHTHGAELSGLLAKLISAKANGDDSVRETVLAYWQATPEGEDFHKKHVALKALKQRTAQQEAAFSASTKQQNAISLMLQRTVDTHAGMQRLTKTGRTVNVAKIANTKQYACFVVNTKLGEFEQIRFTAKQLQSCCEATFTDATSTADVRIACGSKKAGTPNAKVGANGDAIEPVKMRAAIEVMDTSIANVTSSDGKSLALSPPAKQTAFLLWARLDSIMSDADKKAAREAFAKLGVKEVAPAPAPVAKSA